MKRKIIALALSATTLFLMLSSCNFNSKEKEENSAQELSLSETTDLQETTQLSSAPQSSSSITPEPPSTAHETRYFLLKNDPYNGETELAGDKMRVISSEGEITIPYGYSTIYAVENPFTERTEILNADDLIFVCRDGDQSLVREVVDEHEQSDDYEPSYEGGYEYLLTRDAALAYPDGRILTDFIYSDSGEMEPAFIAPDLIAVGMKGDKEFQILSYPSLETLFSLKVEEEFYREPSVFGEGETLTVFEEDNVILYDLQSIRDGNPQILAEFPGFEPLPSFFFPSPYGGENRYLFLYGDGMNSNGIAGPTGNWIVPPNFSAAMETSDPNYFIVNAGSFDDSGKPEQSGVYDVAAQDLIIPFQDKDIYWYTKDTLCIQEYREINGYSTGFYYLCDSDTLKQISAEYEYMETPQDGSNLIEAAKRDSNQEYLVGVMLDWRTGNEIPKTPESEHEPEETAITIDGKLFVRKDVLDDRFSIYAGYSNEEFDDNTCLYDAQTQTMIIPPERGYTDIYKFSKESGGYYNLFVDMRTDDVYFAGVTKVSESFFRYALLNDKGEILVDNLNNIHLFDGDYIVVDRGMYTGLMDIKGNWIWKAKRFDILVD